MKAAKLRHKVEIQKYVTTKDTFGEEIKTYEHFKYAYAEIRSLLGRENFAEKQLNSTQTHKIKIRYLAGIDSTMRILHNNRVFELIGFPVNYEERNIFLTFNVAEKYDGGDIHPPSTA